VSDATVNGTNVSARRRGLLWLGVVVLLGALVAGGHWFFHSRHFQSTEDAYVNGDMVQVTSDVTGTVVALDADDTQAVQRGQELIRLDDADARIALGRAEAELGRAVRQVRALYAQSGQMRTQIAERETALARAEDDLRRRTGLERDAVSGEELSHARDVVVQARAALQGTREQLAATNAQIDGTTISTHPQVLAAAAAVRDAHLAVRRTRITAPVAGVIARRAVQVGQRVAAGAPLMSVVPLNDVWVDANFKEVQLKDLRVGQPVTLHSDLYGSDTEYHGKVAGLSAGSGSAFALLPAQNASGNWIKIVQRVPVRIALEPTELTQRPLRVGLSMSVDVDVRDSSGTQVAGSLRNQPIASRPETSDDSAVDARIARIISDNEGEVRIAARNGGHP